MSHPVTSRVLEIENALADVLRNGDFKVTTEDGERFLVPDFPPDFNDLLAFHGEPHINLSRVARELERLLS